MLLETNAPIQPHNKTSLTMFRAPTQGATTPDLGHQPKENQPLIDLWDTTQRSYNPSTEIQLNDHNQNINYKSCCLVTSESCNHFIYLTLSMRYLLCYTGSPLLMLSTATLLLVNSIDTALHRYDSLPVLCLTSLQLPSLLLYRYGHYQFFSATS